MLNIVAPFNALKKLAFRHPGRTVGIMGALGDGAMAASGLMFDNLGRAAASLFGLGANLPLVFFAERKRRPDEIDPQDLPFRQKIKHIWKFWKYPFEFGALCNITQTIGIMLFSGPDTASVVGEAARIDTLISQDSFRPMETLLGVGGVVGSSIGLIKEAERPAATVEENGFLPQLKRDFNGVSGFMKDRATDLVSGGLRVDKSVAAAFQNACFDIAVAGPNKVTAKIFNILLYPWAIESALRGDWSNVASACAYRACNYFYERASKRAPTPA